MGAPSGLMPRILPFTTPPRLCIYGLCYGYFSIKVRYRLGGASVDFLSIFAYSQITHLWPLLLAELKDFSCL